ncbi:Uncharacterised protein [uncultured Ruminococcus sp.]|nr:Uncharacterised protein [uncultured Clostridium sp.]SCI51771.1 Uncharacterised protein [uncultured Ruminococcus sp.]
MSEEMKNEMIESVEDVTTEKTAEVQGGEKQEAEKKYTDEDVDRIIARKIAAERKRMSKLFNEEQQESELEKRERAVLLRELKADAKDMLISEGLPSSLAGLLNYSSKEELSQSMAEVSAIFREAVQQGVKEKLRGETPRKGTGVSLNAEKALANAFKPGAR